MNKRPEFQKCCGPADSSEVNYLGDLMSNPIYYSPFKNSDRDNLNNCYDSHVHVGPPVFLKTERSAEFCLLKIISPRS